MSTVKQIAKELIKQSAAEQMADDYVGYAVSTLNRALPSAVDGLKVSQRRAVFAALKAGFTPDKPFKKVSRLDGEITGKYHPHGSAAGTVIQLGRHDANMHRLFNIHGNTGGGIPNGQTISKDGPAASRYLEQKLSDFAYDVYFEDETYKFVATRPNYDDTLQEPIELVPAVPMGLLLGQSGISTGYATNTFNYRLNDIKDLLHGKLSVNKLVPDFTAHTAILADELLHESISEGHGSAKMRGNYTIDTNNRTVTITSIPTGSAESFCDKAADCEAVASKLKAIDDYSDGNGIKIVLTYKSRNVDVAELEHNLLTKTPLESTQKLNSTLLFDGLPNQCSPENILAHWLEARKNVLQTKAQSDAIKLAEQIHLLAGHVKAIDLIKVVRKALLEDNEEDAKQLLYKEVKLDEIQANFILNLSIRKLLKSNKELLIGQMAELEAQLNVTKELQTNPGVIKHIKKQVAKLAKKYGKERVCPVVSSLSYPTVAKQPKSAKPSSRVDEIKAEANALWVPISGGKVNKILAPMQNAKHAEELWERAMLEHMNYWNRPDRVLARMKKLGLNKLPTDRQLKTACNKGNSAIYTLYNKYKA